MPKQGTRAEVNTFVKGLITEASPLNFPADASQEEENFVLKRDGTRQRRKGMDYIPGFAFFDPGLGLGITSNGFNTFIWNSVEGDPNVDVLVVQTGNILYFYKLGETDDGFIDATTLVSFPTDVVFSFASIEGKLVVVSGSSAVIIISLVGTTISSEEIKLKVRDFWGVEV